MLGLSHNQLTAVEGSSLCRGKMVRLEWLDLDGNDLPLLPAALATLAPNLRTLSAVGNARLDTNKAQVRKPIHVCAAVLCARLPEACGMC